VIDLHHTSSSANRFPDLNQQLQKCGYRLTAPRQRIVDILSHTDRHLTAEEIYLQVHKTYPNIGLATVYRTVEMLVRMGAIMKFDFGEHKARYELTTEGGPRHHHHAVCTHCGKIINYANFMPEETELFKRTAIELQKKYHFQIKHHLVQFYGVCDTCKTAEHKPCA
jgi:Fur family ferric uptake transcriptional regulator